MTHARSIAAKVSMGGQHKLSYPLSIWDFKATLAAALSYWLLSRCDHLVVSKLEQFGFGERPVQQAVVFSLLFKTSAWQSRSWKIGYWAVQETCGKERIIQLRENKILGRAEAARQEQMTATNRYWAAPECARQGTIERTKILAHINNNQADRR